MLTYSVRTSDVGLLLSLKHEECTVCMFWIHPCVIATATGEHRSIRIWHHLCYCIVAVKQQMHCISFFSLSVHTDSKPFMAQAHALHITSGIPSSIRWNYYCEIQQVKLLYIHLFYISIFLQLVQSVLSLTQWIQEFVYTNIACVCPSQCYDFVLSREECGRRMWIVARAAC